MLSASIYCQTTLNFSRTPGADQGPGIPACSEEPGWFSLFDGTPESMTKYWFNPSGQFHGDNSRWWVTGGVLYSDQSSDRRGGCIYTKKQYKNVEVKIHTKPYYGNDAGIFLRSTLPGRAMQVVIDYVTGPTKAIGGIWGENRSDNGINYKPFGFTSPTTITVRSEWYSDGLQGRPKLEAADWAGKIWKANDYNWVAAKIYNDNVPIIDTWINNDYQMVSWRESASAAAKEVQEGYITLQVHAGSGSWSINNPNLYKAMLVRVVQPNGQPLASYPEWSAVCATSTLPGKALNRAPSLDWRVGSGGLVAIEGKSPEAYSLSLADAGGRIIYESFGAAGSFAHTAKIKAGTVNVLTVRTSGHRESYKIFHAGD